MTHPITLSSQLYSPPPFSPSLSSQYHHQIIMSEYSMIQARHNNKHWRQVICLFICLTVSICTFVFPSVCLSICLSAYLSIFLSAYLSIFLSVYLSGQMTKNIHIINKQNIYTSSQFISINQSVCLSICLSVYHVLISMYVLSFARR